MPIIAEGWEVYDNYSKTFMCYTKMKHLLRCVVCSEEMEKESDVQRLDVEPCMALLRCGHVVCKPGDEKHTKMCLETLRDNAGSTEVAEDLVHDATELSGEMTAEPGTSATVSAADTTATWGLETTADPRPSTTVSGTDEKRTETHAGLIGETTSESGASPTVSGEDEEMSEVGARVSGNTSTPTDSETGTSESWPHTSGSHTPVVTYTCTTCDLVTSDQEVTSLRKYMQGVMELHRKLESILVEGTRLDIACNTCTTIHKESAGAVFCEAVKVCTHCVPTHFFCAGVCADAHGEKTSHKLESYDPSSHEWLAMVTRAACVYPNIYRQIQDSRLENPCGNESILLADALPPSKLGEYREVIKDIQWNISLFCRMTECQKETVEKLPELCPALSSESKKTLAEDYYSSTEKVHTIEEETIKINILSRQTAHLMFLEALVQIHPEFLDWWKVVIRQYFCLANLMEYCFPLWRIPRTNDVVIPCTNLVSRPLQLNLQEVFDQAERMPGSDVAQTKRMQESDEAQTEEVQESDEAQTEGVQESDVAQTESRVVDVSMQIFLRPGLWHDKYTKTFTYQKSKNKHPDGSGFRKSVQIADNLYAVSSDSKLFLVRKSVYGTLLSYVFSPTKTDRFGHGLWWNGRYLVATCIGTNYIARWDFKTIKDTFIVRYSKHTINSNVLFAVRDTLVEVDDRLCICYDKLIPGRDILGDTTFQCFELATGINLNVEFPRVFIQPPSVIQAPWLISASGSLPYVILRNDDQRNIPALFVFSDLGSELSWSAIQFHFPRADSARRKVVKDVWFLNENTLCLSLELNDANPELETSNEEVHINLTKKTGETRDAN